MMNVMIKTLPKFYRSIEKEQVNQLKGSRKLHKEGDKWSSRGNRNLSGMERKALKQTNKKIPLAQSTEVWDQAMV